MSMIDMLKLLLLLLRVRMVYLLRLSSIVVMMMIMIMVMAWVIAAPLFYHRLNPANVTDLSENTNIILIVTSIFINFPLFD